MCTFFQMSGLVVLLCSGLAFILLAAVLQFRSSRMSLKFPVNEKYIESAYKLSQNIRFRSSIKGVPPCLLKLSMMQTFTPTLTHCSIKIITLTKLYVIISNAFHSLNKANIFFDHCLLAGTTLFQ